MGIQKTLSDSSSSTNFLLQAASSSTNKNKNTNDKAVHGKVKVKYPNQDEMEVEADAYVSELRSEIKRLREEMLASQKANKQQHDNQDLLSYIRSLPPKEMRQLTHVSEDILTAMK